MTETVLLVEHDVEQRAAIGDWLERAGYDVLECPGPQAPDYECIGSAGASCPIARIADVVVLDLRLAPDEQMRGTPAWHLLTYYVEHGKRVVALTGDSDPVRPLEDDDVLVVERPAIEEDLLDAVSVLAMRAARRRGAADVRRARRL